MKIGVISDTHIPATCSELPPRLVEILRDCDMMLHAGDLIELRVLESLKNIARVEAVYGNMDSLDVRTHLPQKKILDVEGKKICLMHGYGRPDNLIELLKKEFAVLEPDIIVFGHSHMPMNEYIDGILFFNPGSATDTIFAPYRSYGIIEIIEGKIHANIYKLP